MNSRNESLKPLSLSIENKYFPLKPWRGSVNSSMRSLKPWILSRQSCNEFLKPWRLSSQSCVFSLKPWRLSSKVARAQKKRNPAGVGHLAVARPSVEKHRPTRPRSFASPARTHDTNTKRNRNRFPGWGQQSRLFPPTSD